ncbi:MAG: hypothetical protein VR68_05185 [Peptococcaceae bacterium BRH_c4a]|nr:MAG: hypothetical protein VR68_05185 [Peptococcaceae bacterium BRH_c4a]
MEKSVKDIMIPIEKFPTIPAGSSVKEVLGVLRKAMESGNNATLLVMENNTLAGILSFREILQAVNPVVFKEGIYRGWSVTEELSVPLFLNGFFTEKCREISNLEVRDVMRPANQFLNLKDTLMKALHAFVTNGFEAVPVWQDGRIVGMVGPMEVIGEMAAILTEISYDIRDGKKLVAG